MTVEMCIIEGTAQDVEGKVNHLLTQGWKLWAASAVDTALPIIELEGKQVIPLAHAIYLSRQRVYPETAPRVSLSDVE